MAYIGKKPEDKFRGLASYDTFTGDGSTTTFDVTNVLPDGGTYDVEVFVDNVRQEGGSGKSYTIGNDGNGDLKRITFAVAPDNAAEIYVINPGRNTAILQVSDNTVTTAKIQDDAVTNAKIGPAAVGATEISPGSITTTQISPSAAITNSQLANSSITINGNAVSLGGSITAGTDWQAVTVADGSTTLNAVAGKGYFLDTNAGVIEVFLPTSPSRGDTVILMDYAGTFATNQVIVNTGTTNLDSTTTRQYKLTTNDTIAEFVYVDSAKGWVTRINTTTGTTPSGVFNEFGGYDNVPPSYPYIGATGGTVTESGDYKIHTFTGDGCFVVTYGGAGTACAPSVVDYLVIAGGGGGGGSLGGGGGAGGYRESKAATSPTHTASPHTGSPVVSTTGIALTATTYPVTVGSGGAGIPAPGSGPGTSGSNSIFSTITSTGGGGGGGGNISPAGPGGSGGGSDGYGNTNGTGNSPPTSPSQGNPGAPTPGGGPPYGSGGGGGIGATAPAIPGGGQVGGPGGPGVTSCISGSPVTRGGGGSGSPYGSTTDVIPGAPGGGGASANPASPAPAIADMAGDANTGGGGGGTGEAPKTIAGGAGGKGIVILRYKFQ